VRHTATRDAVVPFVAGHRPGITGANSDAFAGVEAAAAADGHDAIRAGGGVGPLPGFYTTGNPAILYDNIEGANGVWSATDKSQECLQHDIYAGRPMGIFNKALAEGTVPDFNYVLPNGCEDGEANCKPINNRYTQFDSFLAREIPKILASPSFGSDGLIIVTYDESERQNGMDPKYGYGGGGHVATLFLGPQVQPANTRARTTTTACSGPSRTATG